MVFHAECQSYLACIARRMGFAEKTVTVLGLEQFTTKQDLNGKILDCDTRLEHLPSVRKFTLLLMLQFALFFTGGAVDRLLARWKVGRILVHMW